MRVCMCVCVYMCVCELLKIALYGNRHGIMWKTTSLEKLISFLNLTFRILQHTSSEAGLNENNITTP